MRFVSEEDPLSSGNNRARRSFRQWLKLQVERQDPVGDLARDLLNDECARGLRTISSISSHLIGEHLVSGNVLDALDRAWREFDSSRG